MKLSYKLLICLLSITDILYSQTNLVINGSFENVTSSCQIGDICSPDNWSFNYINKTFRGAIFIARRPPNDVLYIDDNGEVPVPSITVSVDPSNSYYGNQEPSNGNNYIGICSIKEGFFTTNTSPRGSLVFEFPSPLIVGKDYLLRFKVSKMEISSRIPKIKVLLEGNSKEQVVYNKRVYSDGSENANPNGIESWISEEMRFKVNESNLKFLKFNADTKYPPYVGPSYNGVYLDEVELYDYCDYVINTNPIASKIACTQTYGPMNFSAQNTFHTRNQPFNIITGNNVRKLEVTINPVGGQALASFSEQCTNGIAHPVYWNGRTNGGGECAAGWYAATIKAYNGGINNCDNNETKTINFFKSNAWPQTTIVPNHPVCNDPNPVTYTDCCPYMPSLIITNEIFKANAIYGSYGTADFEYRFLKEITFGPNNLIENGVNVSLHAGERINLVPPLEIKGNLTTKIEQCVLRLGNNLTDTNSIKIDNLSSVNSVEIIESEYFEDLNNIIVYPNPISSRKVVIKFPNSISTKLNVEVFDEIGKFVESFECFDSLCEIDLIGKYHSGIYCFRIQTENKIFMKKLIVLLNE